MTELSDAQLVVGSPRFNDDALAETYRRHGGAVFGLAAGVRRPGRGRGGGPGRLLAAVEPARPLRRLPGSLRTFLLAQSHGRAVDLVRSRAARRRREERDARATANAGYDLDHEVWDLTVADQVAQPMGELPTRSAGPSSSPTSRATPTARSRSC